MDRWFPNLSDVDPKVAEAIRQLYDSVYYLLGKNEVEPEILKSLRVQGSVYASKKDGMSYADNELIPYSAAKALASGSDLSFSAGDISTRPSDVSAKHNLHWMSSPAVEIQYYHKPTSSWQAIASGGGGTSDHALLGHLEFANSGHSGFQAAISSVGILAGSGSSISGIAGASGQFLKCTGSGTYAFDSIPGAITVHNDLSGIQGGTAGEYYHLTSAQSGGLHARQHAITSASDHTSSATPGQILKSDENGLPVNATNTDAELSSAVILKHARQHAITSSSDHTSSATAGQMLKADTNGLPVNASNTDAEVAAAVSVTPLWGYKYDFGFVASASPTLSVNNPSGDNWNVTLTGTNWKYFRAGVLCTVAGNKSVTIPGTPPTTGTYYIYIDATDGTLTCSTSPWTLEDTFVPVCVVNFNNTLTPKYWYANEMHTCLWPRRLHWEHHFTEGSEYISGGVVSGLVVSAGSPSGDTDNTCAISQAIFADEDLKQTLSALVDQNGTATNYVIFYRTSSSAWSWIYSAVPFKYGTYIQYDLTGTMTEGQHNKWYNTYLLYTNLNDLARFVFIPGRSEFASADAAYAESPAAFDFTGFGIAESIIAYQFTWVTNSSYETKGKCKLVRQPVQIKISTATATVPISMDHNSLSGLQGGTTGEYYHATSAQIAALHPAVTLDTNADAVLSVTSPGQVLGLDTQTANKVWAGPTTGAAAVPTFRSLVTADLPAGIGTVTGSGADKQIAYWTAAGAIGGENDFWYDAANNQMGIGTAGGTLYSVLELRKAVNGALGPILCINNNYADNNTGASSALDFGVDGTYGGTPNARIMAVAHSSGYSANITFSNYESSLKERMRIQYDGNVGIGSSLPKSLVEIRKDSSGAIGPILCLNNAAADNVAGTGGAIDFGCDASYDGAAGNVRITAIASGSGYGAHLTFQNWESSQKERMRLTATGRLGLNTTGPDKQLEINSATGACLRLTYNDADGSASNYVDLSVTSDGKLTIDSSGNVVKLSDYTSNGFLKTGSSDGTLSVDTSTYLTSVTAHNLLSATHGDTTAGTVVRGDIITGQGATPKWTRLAIGTTGKVLISDGTDVGWSSSALGTGAYATIANYLPLAGGTMSGSIVMAASTYIGPSSTTGVYFKDSNVGFGTASPGSKVTVAGGIINNGSYVDITTFSGALSGTTDQSTLLNFSLGNYASGNNNAAIRGTMENYTNASYSFGMDAGNYWNPSPAATYAGSLTGLRGVVGARAGTLTTAVGVNGSVYSAAGSAIGSAYAMQVSYNVAANTVTNLYGIYINATTAGTSLNYALYATSGKTYLGGDVELNTKMTTYNNVATEGYGVPAIVDYNTETNRNTNLADQTISSTNSNPAGIYEVSGFVTTTTTDAAENHYVTLWVKYTDISNAEKFEELASCYLPTLGSYSKFTKMIAPKASSSIVYYIDNSGGSTHYGSSRYAYYVCTKRLN